MKIISIQVGLPKDVVFRGVTITTGIFKDPIKGPVMVRKTNLEGDRQADLTVHGGVDKAVYAFSYDAYSWWQKIRPNDTLAYGAFGENLTVDKMPEDQIYIGDSYEVGDTILEVAQPRFPCYKLGVKFQDPTVLKTFMKSGRPGVYFRVLKEGKIEAGDAFKLIRREKVLLSVKELFQLNVAKLDRARLLELLTLTSLPTQFLDKFQSLVDKS